MNHSLPVILDFISLAYKMPVNEVLSESRNYPVVKARGMMILLAGKKRDGQIAKVFGQSRTNIVNNRRNFLGNMEYNKSLQNEFRSLQRGLIYYEIS